MNTLATFFASIIALFSGLLGHASPPTTTQQPVNVVSKINGTASSSMSQNSKSSVIVRLVKASSSNVSPLNFETSNKNGIVYFQYTNTNNWNDSNNGLEIDLRFRDVNNPQSKELIHMSGAKGGVYPATNFVYHNQVIYFINKDGKLSKIESGELDKVVQINLSLHKEDFVADFFIKDNLIYYLSGPFCDVYMGVCNNELKIYNITNGRIIKLADGIKENTISGFTQDGNKLILSNGSGDAGCAWQSYLTFDLTQSIVIGEDRFSWCSEENGTDLELKKKEDFESKIYPKASTTPYLKFTDGKFIHEESQEVLDLINPKDGRSSLELIRLY